jgi:hypothetical protein
MHDQRFSEQIEKWLKSKQPKTLENLVNVFDEKSFAVCFLVLLAIPALPIPTGGLTHLFEIVALFLCGEILYGRKTVWLPKRWRTVNLAGLTKRKVVTKIIKWLKWIEKHSRPRWSEVVNHERFLRLTGFIVAIYCLAAFLAPPFSGLDTLPALGVVLLSLALIFGDFALYAIGVVFGMAGIGLIISFGAAIFHSFKLFA